MLRPNAPAENAQTGTKREGRPGEAAPKQPRLKVGQLLRFSLRKSPKYAAKATWYLVEVAVDFIFYPSRLILAPSLARSRAFFFRARSITPPSLLQPQARSSPTNPSQHSRCCRFPVCSAVLMVRYWLRALRTRATCIFPSLPLCQSVNQRRCGLWLVESHRCCPSSRGSSACFAPFAIANISSQCWQPRRPQHQNHQQQ